MIFLRSCQSRFIPGMNAGAFVSKLGKLKINLYNNTNHLNLSSFSLKIDQNNPMLIVGPLPCHLMLFCRLFLREKWRFQFLGRSKIRHTKVAGKDLHIFPNLQIDTMVILRRNFILIHPIQVMFLHKFHFFNFSRSGNVHHFL